MKLKNTIFTASIITLSGLLSVACGGPNDGSAGDGDSTTAGDGDSTTAGDGDSTTAGDGDSTAGDGDGDGDGDTEPMGMGGSGDEFPNGPPTILSTNVLDGDAGIMPESTIIIEFSEPMDRKSVEDAYGSKNLSSENVEFAWSEDWRTLTITPNKLLQHAQGDSVEELKEATAYFFQIENSALSNEGEPLEEDYKVGFTTARKVTTAIEGTGTFMGSVRSDGDDFDAVYTGDSAQPDLYGQAYYAATLSINLESVVDDPIEITWANLSMKKNIHSGAPYSLSSTTTVYSVDAEERSWEVISPQLIEDNVLGNLQQTVMTSQKLQIVDHIKNELAGDKFAQFAMFEAETTNGDEVADAFVYSDIVLYLHYWVE